MLQSGEAQGFHTDYFSKGHGPTDFDRWAKKPSEETPGGADVETSQVFTYTCFYLATLKCNAWVRAKKSNRDNNLAGWNVGIQIVLIQYSLGCM